MSDPQDIPPLDRAYFKRLGKASLEAHEQRKRRTTTETWTRCDELNRMVNRPPDDNDDWLIGHLRYRKRSLAQQRKEMKHKEVNGAR